MQFDICSRDNGVTLRYNRAIEAQRAQEALVHREQAAQTSKDAQHAAVRGVIEATWELERRGFSPAVAQRLVTAIGQRDRITTTWTTTQPAAAATLRRHIFCRPITTEADFATWLHEAGHVLAGPCPG